MRRRDFLKLAGAAASATTFAGCATPGSFKARPRVVVIGAGFGGATAAKYVAMWDPGIHVVLVERGSEFVSCPISNLVLGGNRTMADITRGYDGLRKYGVDVLNGEALAIDAEKKLVRFGRGSELVYDRLVLSPGVDFLPAEIEGYEAAQERVDETLAARVLGLHRNTLLVKLLGWGIRRPPGEDERAGVASG